MRRGLLSIRCRWAPSQPFTPRFRPLTPRPPVHSELQAARMASSSSQLGVVPLRTRSSNSCWGSTNYERHVDTQAEPIWIRVASDRVEHRQGVVQMGHAPTTHHTRARRSQVVEARWVVLGGLAGLACWPTAPPRPAAASKRADEPRADVHSGAGWGAEHPEGSSSFRSMRSSCSTSVQTAPNRLPTSRTRSRTFLPM